MDAGGAVQREAKKKWVWFKPFQFFIKNLACRLIQSRKERRPNRSLRRPKQFRLGSESNCWRSKHGRRLKYRLRRIATGNDHRQTYSITYAGRYAAAVCQMILKILGWSDYRLFGSTRKSDRIAIQTTAIQLLLTKFLTIHFDVTGRLRRNHMALWLTRRGQEGWLTQNGAATAYESFFL